MTPRKNETTCTKRSNHMSYYFKNKYLLTQMTTVVFFLLSFVFFFLSNDIYLDYDMVNNKTGTKCHPLSTISRMETPLRLYHFPIVLQKS